MTPCSRASSSAASSQVSGGGFIRANSGLRLAIMCQSVVAACQPQSRLSSAKIVNDVDIKRLGALPTASGAIARLAYERARRAGIELRPLLKKAALTDQQIKNRSTRLTVHDQITFLNLVADALADEFLGFHLAQIPDLRELGLLFYVAASSETLGDGLRRAARYGAIVNEGLSVRCTEGEEFRVECEYVGVARHSDRHQIEFFMTAIVRLCRHLTGQRLMPSLTRIAHRRTKAGGSDLAAYFGPHITFGARADELTFAGNIKDMPVASADPYLNEILVANCEQALSRRRKNRGPFRAAVENAIVPLLPHGKLRASEIAAKLGLSQRTSARRLGLEGVTFSEVLESLRADLARQYLSDPDLSISRISWLLGYQEVSAFTHAFKRWTGKTPREARSGQSARSNPALRRSAAKSQSRRGRHLFSVGAA
jgi:AraC-like DNA-binding protein